MKEFTTDKIRNICLAGQRGCGKTSLADAIAFCTGQNNRIGNVDDGSSLLDYQETELSRNTTLSSKLMACEWANTKINWFDNPGHPDFIGELFGCLKVSEAAMMVVNAASGVEVGTQIQWESLSKSGVARGFFINKMENENVLWQSNIDGLTKTFGKNVALVQIPIGESASFKGIVDVLRQKAFTFDDKGKPVETDIPADLKDEAKSLHEKLVELAAEGDDALMEKYFEDGTLSEQDFITGFKKSIRSGQTFPVLCGSAKRNMGVTLLLDFVSKYMPSPNEVPVQALADIDSEEMIELTIDPAAKPLGYVFKMVNESHLGELACIKTYSGMFMSGADLNNQQTSYSERVTQMYTLHGKNREDMTKIVAGDIGVLVKLKKTHTGNSLAGSGVNTVITPVEYPNPVMDVAIKSKSKGDEDKIASGLTKLHEEDPTFKVVADPALAQIGRAHV